MKITMAVMKEGDNCIIFADKFPDSSDKFCQSAVPVTFIRRPMFQKDTGKFGPLLTLPLKDAKRMARDILEL